MTWDEYAAGWAELHGGFDPSKASPLVRGWVRLAYRGGSALARRHVDPTEVTIAGLVLCAAVAPAVLLGPVGLIAGALLVLLASLADALDGAVAVISGRVTQRGFILDSVVDRLGELAWLAAFWLAGVPGWLAVAAGAVSWLHEYARARALAAGMSEIGVVTVGERPTRVSVALSGLLVGGVAGLIEHRWAALVLIVAAGVWLALGVVGLAQLAATMRRALR